MTRPGRMMRDGVPQYTDITDERYRPRRWEHGCGRFWHCALADERRAESGESFGQLGGVARRNHSARERGSWRRSFILTARFEQLVAAQYDSLDRRAYPAQARL